jgi:hypothetical protein
LTLTLSTEGLNAMKYGGIGRNAQSSFLSWTDTFVADYSGNMLAPLWDGSIVGKLTQSLQPRRREYVFVAPLQSLMSVCLSVCIYIISP